MPGICFYFRAHQPIALKRISFFEFGQPPDLVDHAQNYRNLQKYIEGIYFPAFTMLQDLIVTYRDAFHFSLSVSGILLDQLDLYYPRYHSHLQDFMRSDQIELISTTYFHSCAHAYSADEFISQLLLYKEKILGFTGKGMNIFCNADSTYHSGLAENINRQQIKGVILRNPTRRRAGKKSPDLLYCDSRNENLKLFLINQKYSEVFRKGPFSSKKKSSGLLKKMLDEIAQRPASLIMIQIDLEDSNIPYTDFKNRLDFIKQFIDLSLSTGKIDFLNPSEILDRTDPAETFFVHEPENRKSTGSETMNIIKKEAFRYLYSLEEKIKRTGLQDLIYLWRAMQSIDHIRKFGEKEITKRDLSSEKWPLSTPHEIYLDYMNALSALDIYAQNRMDHSSDLFHHNPRSVR